jgi:Flp pilus assembly protein CpaB
MRGRRLIAIVVGVIGLLLLAVVVMLFVLQSNQPSRGGQAADSPDGVATLAPGVTPSPAIGPDTRTVEVVVSLQTVQRGWLMTEAELTTDLRLASEVGPNVITNIEDAVGLYARHDIYQGETLTTDSLVRDPRQIGEEQYGPSSLIPAGWVAMAVPMDRLSGVTYGLAPGDSIDVMLSFTLSAIDEEFQTLLNNSVTFYLESPDTGEEGGPARPAIFIIDPYGRFESLPTGDVAHIGPSEAFQRPVPVAVILQNARVIQVGAWTPREPAQAPTPTPDPNAPTPTPSGAPPTPTPSAPNVLLVALPPQQQLFLKYALETSADIDFALRGVNDGQLYTVQNVDLNFLLQQFNIEIPPNYDFTVGGLVTTTLEIEELGGQ